MTSIIPNTLGEDLRLRNNSESGSAEASVWWNQVPTLDQEKIGVIGGFAADSLDSAQGVLETSLQMLRQQGCTLAIGPMDGNTWRKYRFVTDAGTESPFLLEPSNPPTWPDWWKTVGFAPLAEYYSSASSDLTTRDQRVESVAARLTKAGVTIRPLQSGEFQTELERIYEVSAISFRENFLYTPLPKDAFIAQYRAIESRVQPKLVLLAEHAGRPVGYVFAIPNLAQAQAGQPITDVIVKTLAVLPGRAYAGLGAWLLGEVHQAAHALGFKRAIHALMHETNKSRNLSAHYATTIRRYTLFSRRLT